MIRLDRIQFNGETWDFSNYFEYMKSIANLMPKALRDYSTDVESYVLHGARTLHDSRMLSAVIENAYDESFSNAVSSIELNFIDQLFEGKTTLRYVGVSSYHLKEMDLDSNRHADVLVHEFSIARQDVFRHRIIFDNLGEIEIEFSQFSYMWNEL